MAWFSQIGTDNLVQQVIYVSDTHDIAWVTQTYGGIWVETVEGSGQKNFPSTGFTYDRVKDAFIPPKPFASWLLNEDTCLWDAPVAMPDDGKVYTWDEATVNWVEVPVED